jgi:glycosyltransferase involved in cell wall biosynthesis
MNQIDKTAVCILCDESASLFDGGSHLPRFGGAGLHMYLLGKGLALDSRYQVSFVFGYTSAKGLRDDKVSFIELSKRKKSLFGHKTPRAKGEPYAHLPSRRVFISTMADLAPQLVDEASIAGARTIFQTACELDVTNPYERSMEDGEVLLDAIARCDKIFVQTETQQKNLLSTRGKESHVVRKGWPLTQSFLPDEEKNGVLWVGSAQMGKQPWVLFDVARLMPDHSFIAIMPPADIRVMDYALRQTREMKNVHLIDFQLGYKEVQRYFDKALVFLYSTELGTDPALTVIQAAAGRAAIVSERMDPDSGMFSREGCGILAGVGTERVVNAIEQLTKDASLRKSVTDRAYRYAEEHYSYQTMIDEYSQAIDSLCGI